MPLDSTSRRAWLALLKWPVRLAIMALVAWGLYRAGRDAAQQIAEREFSLADVHGPWLAAACFFYIAGTYPAAWFWRQTMLSMGQRPRVLEALRAYCVGQLGKYVPGKALVVVIRAGMIRSERTDATVAALAVFVETLTLMAVGAVLAAVMLMLGVAQGESSHAKYLTWIAIGLGLCAGVPTWPPLFRAIVRRLPFVKSHPAVAPAIEGLRFGLMARGWLVNSIGWTLMGLSLWATLRSLPQSMVEPPSLSMLPLLVACIALATVAGFMSLIPGGLGVRELVVTVLLVPAFGEAAAIISAVLLRMVSLLCEVGVSTILYVSVRSPEP